MDWLGHEEGRLGFMFVLSSVFVFWTERFCDLQT